MVDPDIPAIHPAVGVRLAERKPKKAPFRIRLRWAWTILTSGWMPYVTFRAGARVERVEFHGCLFAAEYDGCPATFDLCLFDSCNPDKAIPMENAPCAEVSQDFGRHLEATVAARKAAQN